MSANAPAIAVPESFQSRPFARRRFTEIARWALARHPFYQRLALAPGQPMPILTRAMVQEHNDLLLNGHPVTGRTSGSTSTPVLISWSKRRARIDVQDTQRMVQWLGGPLPNMKIVSLAAHAKNERTLEINTPIPEQIEFMRERFRVEGACALITYPTNLEMLCRHVIEHGIDMSFLKRCICLSEVYEPYHDQLLARAFPNAFAACTYSSVEMGMIAARCPHRPENYHIMAHKLGVEFLDEQDQPCQPGQVGRVVVTDYENRRTTLVRYALGDLAAPVQCDCGRIDLPAMTQVIGKVRGVLKDRTGRPLIFTNLSPMFRDSPEVGQFQVVQPALDRFLVKIVLRPGADPEPFQQRVRDRFVTEFGPEATVEFEYLGEIPRSPGGKFHGAICLV